MPVLAGPVPTRTESMATAYDCGRQLPRNAITVLQALRESQQPQKAYELLDRLQDRGISAPMTVYRALDRLMSEGLVRKIASLNAFVALDDGGFRRPVLFEICRECGHINVVDLSPSCIVALEALGVDTRTIYVETEKRCGSCHQNGCKPSGLSGC